MTPTAFAPTLSAPALGDAPALGGERAEWVPTPGFAFYGRPCRIEIAIKTDKKGRERATYFSRNNIRWMPLPLVDAKLLIAQGLADEA